MWGQNGRGPQQGQQQQNPWMAGLAQRIAAARAGLGGGQGGVPPGVAAQGVPGNPPGGGWGGPGGWQGPDGRQGLPAGLQGLQGRLPQWGVPGGAPAVPPQVMPGNTGVVGPGQGGSPVPQVGMQGRQEPPQGVFSPGWSRGLRGPGGPQGQPMPQRVAAPAAPTQAPVDDDEEEM